MPKNLFLQELARRCEHPLVFMHHEAWVKDGPCRRRRRALGLTQHAIWSRGKSLEGTDLHYLSPRLITSIETGENRGRVKMEHVAAYGHLINCDPEWFLGDYWKWLKDDPRIIDVEELMKREGTYLPNARGRRFVKKKDGGQ